MNRNMEQTFFKIINRGDYIGICNKQDDEIIFKINNKKWESDFYRRRFASLQIENFDHLVKLRDKQISDALEQLMGIADGQNYDIIELFLDINKIRIIPIIEDAGFRLVDTRITFITLIKKDDYELSPLLSGEIAYATLGDLDAINKLTKEVLVENDGFYGRFKNKRYFSEDEIMRYYDACILNNIENKGTYFIVMKDRERIIAYFIYKRYGLFQGLPLYKGILTAVDPSYRGNSFHIHMQSHLYKQLPEKEYFVDNTTQLTNIPTIKSHIKSQKRLDHIELIFFREKK